MLICSKGVNGLTARDIKLIIDGGYNTVESVAYTYVPLLSCFEFTLKENIGPEGHWSRSRESLSRRRLKYLQKVGTLPYLSNSVLSDFHSIQACPHGFHHSNRNAPTAKRIDIHNYWIKTAGHATRWGH